MISTSDDLYSVFLADLSEKERDRVRRYADRFGIEPTDAVWALMIVLGWYGDLYEAVPQKINVTVQGILEKIQSAAAAEAESSRVRLQASLTDAVVGAAESVAARKGLPRTGEMERHCVHGWGVHVRCVFVLGYWLGFDHGRARGFNAGVEGSSCGVVGAVRRWFAGIRTLEGRRSGAFDRLRPARLEAGVRGLLPQG
jgi:hypothetical protein